MIASLNDFERGRTGGPRRAGQSNSPHRKVVVTVDVGGNCGKHRVIEGRRTRVGLDIVKGVLNLIRSGSGDLQTQANLEVLLLNIAGNPVRAGG